MVTLGQEREKARFPGCSEDESRCPDEVTEAFNTFGSWMVTFGIGAVRWHCPALHATGPTRSEQPDSEQEHEAEAALRDGCNHRPSWHS